MPPSAAKNKTPALRVLKPPVAEDGEWIPYHAFVLRFGLKHKSFGHYVCTKCQGAPAWVSAHAQTGFRQQCKKCDTWVYPEQMWVNAQGGKGRDRNEELTNKAPHRSDLCEACMSADGLCMAALSLN